MRVVHKKSNWYIRRRLTFWDPTTRKDIPYVGPTPAPDGFFATTEGVTTLGGAIHATLGGAMTHIGDGWWEKKILGADLTANLGTNTKGFEIVVISSLQYHDAEEVKFYDRRVPGVA